MPHTTVELAEQAPTSLIYNKAFTAASVMTASVAGSVTGAIVANYRYPTTINYADGIQAHASLTFSPGLAVEAPISRGISPNVPVDTPFPDLDGLHTTIDKLQLNLSDKRAQGEYIGLLTNFHDAVVKPTADSIINHLALGAGVGAAAAAGISYAAIRYARRIKTDNTETREDIKRLSLEGSEATTASASRQEIKLTKESRRRKLVAGLASLAILSGLGITTRDAIRIESTPTKDGTPLASILTNQVQELKGTRISGGADQINTVIYGINELKVKADKPWRKGYKNLLPALKKYSQTKGKIYADNPDIVRIAHVTDLHCNLANYGNYFGPMLRRLKPDVVAVTGDTQTNSGTMFYEKSCVPGLVKMVEASGKASNATVPIVYEPGNHDDKKPYKGGSNFYNLTSKKMVAEIPLGENDYFTTGSLAFVGKEDPRSTIWYPTTPVNESDQFKGLAKQGRDTANVACRLQSEGKTVVVMAHAEQAGYATNTRGCASLNLNGHTHHELPVRGVRGENGKLVMQHTGGSTSGAGAKFSIYEGPQQDASTTVFYYSKSKSQFVGYYTVILHKDSTVNITGSELPAPEISDREMAKERSFDEIYGSVPLTKDPTAQHKVAVVKHG